MVDTRSTNTIRIITPNTSMADTQSINTIRITTLNTSTLRIITLRIKASADRTPILGRGPIVGAAAFHAENTA
jgi:hypothetical protein